MKFVRVTIGLLRWLRQQGYSPVGRVVFVYMLLHLIRGEKGAEFPIKSVIGRELGVDPKTLRKILTDLELQRPFDDQHQLARLGFDGTKGEKFFGLVSWAELRQVIDLLGRQREELRAKGRGRKQKWLQEHTERQGKAGRHWKAAAAWSELVAYLYLTTFAKTQGGVAQATTREVRTETLAKQMGLQPRRARELLERLRTAGVIKQGEQAGTWVLVPRLPVAGVVKEPKTGATLLERLAAAAPTTTVVETEEGTIVTTPVGPTASIDLPLASVPLRGPIPTPPLSPEQAIFVSVAPDGRARGFPLDEWDAIKAMPQGTPQQRIARREAQLAYIRWMESLVRFQDLDPIFEACREGSRSNHYDGYTTDKERSSAFPLIERLDRFATVQDAEKELGSLAEYERRFFDTRRRIITRTIRGRLTPGGIPDADPPDPADEMATRPKPKPVELSEEDRYVYNKMILEEWKSAHEKALLFPPGRTWTTKRDAGRLLAQLEAMGIIVGPPDDTARGRIRQLFMDAGAKVIKDDRKLFTIAWVSLLLAELTSRQ